MSRSQFDQYVESGAVWQPMVEHDQVDSVTANAHERLGAGCRGPDLVRLPQEETDHFWDDRLIVYHQDLLPSGGHSAISTIWRRSRLGAIGRGACSGGD